jgi:hypothetical protein
MTAPPIVNTTVRYLGGGFWQVQVKCGWGWKNVGPPRQDLFTASQDIRAFIDGTLAAYPHCTFDIVPKVG